MGDLLQCGCEATRNRPPPKPLSSSSYGDGVKWEWGGCVDDVEFGYEKSKQFMDAKRRRGKSDIRALIDLHNNEAGRLVRDVDSGFLSGFHVILFKIQRAPCLFECSPNKREIQKRKLSPTAVFVYDGVSRYSYKNQVSETQKKNVPHILFSALRGRPCLTFLLSPKGFPCGSHKE